MTKGFQKTPDYSAIYRLERHLTVFYIAQNVPSFVVLYLNISLKMVKIVILSENCRHFVSCSAWDKSHVKWDNSWNSARKWRPETLVILIKGTNIAIPMNDIIADMEMNLEIWGWYHSNFVLAYGWCKSLVPTKQITQRVEIAKNIKMNFLFGPFLFLKTVFKHSNGCWGLKALLVTWKKN